MWHPAHVHVALCFPCVFRSCLMPLMTGRLQKMAELPAVLKDGKAPVRRRLTGFLAVMLDGL